MEVLKGQKINYLPFRDLNKVSDLLYYEGPILSHFKDKYNKDILFYWVDYDNQFNRWLLLQVSEEQLYRYLFKKASLRDLFAHPVNDIFYSVEIANSLEYNNVTQIFLGDLTEVYIPEVDSFFEVGIPDKYRIPMFQNEHDEIIDYFINTAMYIKAVPKKNSKNRGLVNVLDASDFLYAIGKSFDKKMEYDVRKAFYERGIADNKRIVKATKNLAKVYQLNIAKSAAASFAVALSPNQFIDTDERFLNREWLLQFFETFQKDVIGIDTKTSDEIDEILSQYKGDDISDIYRPILELYNNKNFSINFTDREFKTERVVQPIKLETALKLLPGNHPKVKEDETERLALVKVTESGKFTKNSLTLFDQNIKSSWDTMSIHSDNTVYYFGQKLYSDYKREHGLHIIENEDLDIYASGETLDEAIYNFSVEFDLLHHSIFNLQTLSPAQEKIKKFLNFLIDHNT